MFPDKHKTIYFRLFNNLNLDVKGRSEINKKVIIIRTRHGKRFLLTTARKRFQNALLRSREQKEKKILQIKPTSNQVTHTFNTPLFKNNHRLSISLSRCEIQSLRSQKKSTKIHGGIT